MTLLQITTTVTNEATKVASSTFSYVDKLKDFAVSFAPKIVGAILLFIIGKWIISKIVAITRKILLAKDYAFIRNFSTFFSSVTLTILLFVSIAGILGVDTTAFSALIVGAGVAIGSALNGTLGNFAGGVMMLIFKPFKVGDMIEVRHNRSSYRTRGF